MSSFEDAAKGAKMDFAKDKSYGDYLGLDKILTVENPLDMAHDGLLFIIQHQTSELWMKLAIHELTEARKAIAAGSCAQPSKCSAGCRGSLNSSIPPGTCCAP